MHESLPDSDAVLAQFNRLIQELLRGSMNRNTFRPWEVELLLDIEACNLRDSSRRENAAALSARRAAPYGKRRALAA